MKYDVILTRNITESVSITVEAADESEAGETALDTVGAYGDDIGGWDIDEGNSARAYVSDIFGAEDYHKGETK